MTARAMAVRALAGRVWVPALIAALGLASPAIAQQFDNFGNAIILEDFDLDSGDIVEGVDGLTISENGGLIPDTGTGDTGLGPGNPQGSFESFPGVTGPVTSISQPQTEQGNVVALRALDKMLGQPTDIELSLGQTVVFGRIAIRLIECRYPSVNPDGDAFAHLEVLDLNGETLFDGWMIASSPALSALEHPRYDVWVLHCTVPS